MSKLKLEYNDDNDTIELSFKDEELKSFITYSIKQSTRTWFPKKSCWVVLPEVLPDIIAFSRHTFNHIDTSSLPIKYQKIIQDVLQGNYKKSKNNIKKPSNYNSNYEVLFLKESAPKFLVKAVYKALAKHYHPDGESPNSEEFVKIKDAYESIQKSWNQ